MKKLWNENRVLFLLIVILITCFIAIVCVTLTFFYSKDVGSYGDRLKDIEKYPITEKDKDKYEETLLENEGVTKVTMNIKGRIIYIHTEFSEEVKLEDAKALIANSLEDIGEENLSYYDLEFILKSDNFTILGAKNTTIDYISWNNNRVVEEVEEESNEK